MNCVLKMLNIDCKYLARRDMIIKFFSEVKFIKDRLNLNERCFLQKEAGFLYRLATKNVWS